MVYYYIYYINILLFRIKSVLKSITTSAKKSFFKHLEKLGVYSYVAHISTLNWKYYEILSFPPNNAILMIKPSTDISLYFHVTRSVTNVTWNGKKHHRYKANIAFLILNYVCKLDSQCNHLIHRIFYSLLPWRHKHTCELVGFGRGLLEYRHLVYT